MALLNGRVKYFTSSWINIISPHIKDAIIHDCHFHNVNAPKTIMQMSGICEFLTCTIDPCFCGNMLDLPNIRGESSPFIG